MSLTIKSMNLKVTIWPKKNEEIDNIRKNALLVYNKQVKFFDDILKSKQRTSTKRISSEKLFKPGLSSSPLSIRFLSQETIAERVKLKLRERKIF